MQSTAVPQKQLKVSTGTCSKQLNNKDTTPMPGTEISDWWDMTFKLGAEQTLYTYDPAIFHYEKWAVDSFTYKLPAAEPGDYVIITQHTEVN